MAAGPIVISILANAAQANATLNQTTTLAGKIGGGFQKMRLPAVAALGAVAAGAKAAIDSASDLSESVSKTGQIFGPQAAEIEKFAAGAAKSLGQSKTAALEAASTFGIIGQSAGLSGSEAAKFSKQFVGLSSDLASFNNTSPEEAVTAIGAAMRGESEPIRKYGVMLDDATLRARAMKLGLIDNVKQALTPQQKALAASREILAQTTKAQGDFGRTAQGAANQQRIQAAAAENLRAKLGSALLPAYIKLQQAGLAALAWMSKHTTAVKAIAVGVAVLAAAILIVNVAMAASSAVTAIFTGVLAVARGAIMAARIAMFLFNIALYANPVVFIVAGIIALVAVLVLFFTKTKIGQKIITTAWNAIKTATKALGAAFLAVVTAIGGYLTRFVTAVVNAVVRVVTKIREIPAKVRAAVSKFGSVLLDAGKNLIQGLIDGIQAMVGKVGSTLKDLTDYIAAHKGPPSKDKILLRDAGSLIIDGLITGMERRRTALRRQLSDVTRTIETGITPNLGAILTADNLDAAALGNVNANVTYNITVRLDSRMTEAEMGRGYDRAIRAAKRQGLVPA